MSKAKRAPSGAPAPVGTPPYLRWDGEDLLLDCHLQPKASRDEFAGLQGERLKIRLTAPPVDGKANAHLQAFLAQAFGVAKRQVVLEAGELSRLKRVRIRQPAILPAELQLSVGST
jgi:uncharacterized protein (TIGR00251 family)